MMLYRHLFLSNTDEKQPKQWIYIKGKPDSTKEYQQTPQVPSRKWVFKAKICYKKNIFIL